MRYTPKCASLSHLPPWVHIQDPEGSHQLVYFVDVLDVLLSAECHASIVES